MKIRKRLKNIVNLTNVAMSKSTGGKENKHNG